jgi:hypothetical protein
MQHRVSRRLSAPCDIPGGACDARPRVAWTFKSPLNFSTPARLPLPDPAAAITPSTPSHPILLANALNTHFAPPKPNPPGYPLQTYTVVTEDGYVLRMERIPRPGAHDVALFMHGGRTWGKGGVSGAGGTAQAAQLHCVEQWPGRGRTICPTPLLLPASQLRPLTIPPHYPCPRIPPHPPGVLDTSLTWVSSGVTGSQAFAAWDQGFDVWLGSSRSNPPRVATSEPPQPAA